MRPGALHAPGYSPLVSGYFNIPDRLGCKAGGIESKIRTAKTEELNRQDAKIAKGGEREERGAKSQGLIAFTAIQARAALWFSLDAFRFPLPFLSSPLGALAVQFFNCEMTHAQENAPAARAARGVVEIVFAVMKIEAVAVRPLFLAMSDAAPHTTLLAAHLAAALSTAATGHTLSWSCRS
jgi:hypothetical protein